jgi:PPP family 3-phenylpropionic acid transporter
VRLWGSLGFIVTAGGLGALWTVLPVSWLPVVLWGNLIAIWLCSFTITDQPRRPTTEHSSFLQLLVRPQPLLFFAVCFLMQLSHGPYYGFFSIFLHEHGYGKHSIGALWALGVVAEVIVFVFMHHLMARYSLRTLAMASLLLAAVRWCGTAWLPENLAVILGMQLLHAATFGVFHALAIQSVHLYFPPASAGQGQAFYSAVSFGAGGALGAWFSGYTWQTLGGGAAFGLAGGVALLAAILVWVAWREPQRAPHNLISE